MKSTYEHASLLSFRDLNGEVRARELRSLEHEVLTFSPVTRDSLTGWAGGSSERDALLAGTVWGGIHWPKALGKPRAPGITQGFDIVHEFKRLSFVDRGGGRYEDVSHWKVQRAPSVWDATSDSAEFRVGFFFFAGGGGVNPNRLTVSLASVAWDLNVPSRSGYLRLDPHGYAAFGNLGERVVLPDFEVQHVPYSRERSIRAIGPLRAVTASTPR